MRKYKNVGVTCAANHWHPSKLESTVCAVLRKDQDVEKVDVQTPVELTEAKIKYIVDFRVTLKSGKMFYAEAKGMETDAWRIKKKLWAFYGPGELHVYKGNFNKVTRTEIVNCELPNKLPGSLGSERQSPHANDVDSMKAPPGIKTVKND